MAKTNAVSMDDLLKEEQVQKLAIGEAIEGRVLSVRKHEVWVDLGAYGIGLVPRREIGLAKELAEGEAVTVSVVDPEMEEGYALLSLRKAVKERGWDELKRIADE